MADPIYSKIYFKVISTELSCHTYFSRETFIGGSEHISNIYYGNEIKFVAELQSVVFYVVLCSFFHKNSFDRYKFIFDTLG